MCPPSAHVDFVKDTHGATVVVDAYHILALELFEDGAFWQ
jgi:hypothetical protein